MKSPPDVPYCVQTADLAAEHHALQSNPCRSVNDLIDLRARTHPHRLAVAFPEPSHGAAEWSSTSYTFAQLRSASLRLGEQYARLLPRRRNAEETLHVALLCPSGPQYLVTLLACIRLGLGVLLLAPQIQAEAVAHLLGKTECSHLIVHPSLLQLAEAGTKSIEVERLDVIELPPACDADPSTLSSITVDEESQTTAIFFHSSGSSGMPKPISTTHRLLTSVYPCAPSSKDGQGEPRAAFSTTPLFHGGLTDFFRALSALEPIYFFPLHCLPVTADNVQAALACAGPTVRYFFTVPFILKLLLEANALAALKRMDIVSTGGAPLSDELGDFLVEQGVNLVSRYGSSECGFMLSSHRDYETDKAWQWLREPAHTQLARCREFRLINEDTAELIIHRGWPHQVLSNHEDGSYATGDLFTRHPSFPHAWRYAGRADDILVLSNGEKVDPAPIESHLRSSPHLRDAVVFGTNRTATGVLLHFDDINDRSRKELVELVWPEVARANEAAPNHGQVLREMIVPLIGEDAKRGFPTASKGSIQRQQVYDRYAELIDATYRAFEDVGEAGEGERPDETELNELILEVIKTTLGGSLVKPIDIDADLFVYGLNSLQTARVRNVLQKRLDLGGATLATNIVYEHPSARKLASHIIGIRDGCASTSSAETVHVDMRAMVDRFVSRINAPLATTGAPNDPPSSHRPLVVLTGATGSLGAHVLHHLLSSHPLVEIACLVRAETDALAFKRVEASLAARKTSGLCSLQLSSLRVHAAKLGEHNLGLATHLYAELNSRTKLIIHLAWAVNFVASLSSFESEHIASLANLAILARLTSATLVFGSSTASVLGRFMNPIQEAWPDDDASTAPNMGYAQSKWVAEKICERIEGVDVRIARIGQLCGDTREGIWNETEAWPMLLRSANVTGCLPRLDQRLTWLPVDLCARAIVDLAFATKAPSVVHFCNVRREARWLDLLDALRAEGGRFDEASLDDWLERLEKSEADEEANPARKLLGLWRNAYGKDSKPTQEPIFSIEKAAEVSPVIAHLEPLDAITLRRMARHFVHSK